MAKRRGAPVVFLSTLEPGTRFATDYGTRHERRGLVLRQGSMQVTVRYDGGERDVRIVKDGEVVTEFIAPARPIGIAPNTEVTPLTGGCTFSITLP